MCVSMNCVVSIDYVKALKYDHLYALLLFVY